MTTYVCQSEEQTAAAGRAIARTLPTDAIVHLVGDLGAGKTFLARAIAAELGADPLEVASPSFAIVHEYPLPGRPPTTHIAASPLTATPRQCLHICIPDLLTPP